MDLLFAIALLFAALSLAALAAAVRSLRRDRPLGGATGALVALLFLAFGALFGTLSVATRGFQALTREEVAAVVETRPTGDRSFRARVRLPDGTRRSFRLRGDQLYVDARILKWKPIVNVLGLHTAYELDRIGGRYLDLAAERDSPRTVRSLARDRPVDVVRLLERLPFLERLVDAEYGSATFLEVDRPRTLEVRIGTDGLLIRPAGRAGRDRGRAGPAGRVPSETRDPGDAQGPGDAPGPPGGG